MRKLQEMTELFEASQQPTLVITDKRCLKHAGFDNYQNVLKRVRHKDEQPENAERLLVLLNEELGALTQREEFISQKNYLLL